MKQNKKCTLFSVIGIFVAFVSLVTSLSAMGTSMAGNGVAMENKGVYDIKIDNVSEIFSDEEIEVIKSPESKENMISYGVKLKNIDSTTQVQFDIENKGNVNAKVKNVKINGIENYKDNVDVKVLGLNVGDVIDAEIKNLGVKVITQYKNPVIDENGMFSSVILDNINVEIEFDKE